MVSRSLNRLVTRLQRLIPDTMLSFSFTRSSGPGGQNVNKVATRVTLLFDLHGCSSLTLPQKRRVAEQLAGRINRAGVLRVVCYRHRTQRANRRVATERFYTLLAEAMLPQRPRKATGVPAGSRKNRLNDKRRRGDAKRLRKSVGPSDGSD